MKGELVGVWPEIWKSVFKPAIDHDDYGASCAMELYRELIPPPVFDMEDPEPPVAAYDEEGQLVDPVWVAREQEYSIAKARHDAASLDHEAIINDPGAARKTLRRELSAQATSEERARDLLERAYEVIEEFGDQAYSDAFFRRADRAIDLYSLRYDLRRPFKLHPTLPGIFASMVRDVREAVKADAHLTALFRDFEEAIRDLRDDPSPNRMKTVLQKQMNFMEGVGGQYPGVTANTLGRICDQTNSWPHDKVKEAAKALYGFASDYPAIRHGGTPANRLRELDMRDLVAVTIMVAGISPYLTDGLNSERIFNPTN